MNKFSTSFKNMDKVILTVVLLLAAISITTIASANFTNGILGRDVIVQSVAYILGIIAVCIMMTRNYNILKGTEKYLYILSLVLLLLVYVPGLGIEQFSAQIGRAHV